MGTERQERKNEQRNQGVMIVGSLVIGAVLGFFIDRPIFSALALASFTTSLLIGIEMCSDVPCKGGYELKLGNQYFVGLVSMITMLTVMFDGLDNYATSLSIGILIVLVGLAAGVTSGEQRIKKEHESARSDG